MKRKTAAVILFFSAVLSLGASKTAWNNLTFSADREIRHFRGQAGVIVEDLGTGRRFMHQAERSFPAASIVKIPIMAACFQAASEGKLNLSEQVTIKTSDKTSGSGLLKTMPSGSVLTIQQLIELMISQSDNTATNLLIDRLGLDYLNSYFEKSGLKGTKMSRKMMDFSQRKYGVENFTTAEDIAFVLKKIYRGELISPQVSSFCLEYLKRQKLKDRIPAKLPKGIVVAHKTGLERGVCHDAGIVFTGNGNYLICVLSKSPKTKQGSRPAKKFIANLALNTYRTITGSASSGPSRRG